MGTEKIKSDQLVYYHDGRYWVIEGKTLLGALVAESVLNATRMETPKYLGVTLCGGRRAYFGDSFESGAIGVPAQEVWPDKY